MIIKYYLKTWHLRESSQETPLLFYFLFQADRTILKDTKQIFELISKPVDKLLLVVTVDFLHRISTATDIVYNKKNVQ